MGRVRFTLEQFITRFRDTELKDNRGARGRDETWPTN
jgi:hypothetical protein